MLALTVRLLHGTIRAGTPDDTVLAGGEPTGEWPPSPARLYSALVAADGTGPRCTMTTGEELGWLEGLGPPLIVASAPEAVVSSALEPRYVVVDERAEGAVQDYPARMARKVYPGTKLAPRDDTVVYVWPDAEPMAIHRRALAYRAARIGYLGCADSPVSVSVTDRPVDLPADTWRQDERGPSVLPVPYPGFLEALDRAYLAWSAGEGMRRSWIPTRRVRYRPPRHHDDGGIARSTRQVIWLRFERSVSARRVLEVTETLKAAVLDHLQRLLPGEELPSVLHGHRAPGERGSQA
ncbi:MAG: type I-G CRISPR-associated protein Csb2, partial [Acidimicrobiales bacterium]